MRFNKTIVSVVILTCAAAVFSGPLNPPTGPVQTTGRTQINQQFIAALPYVITQPGSYVLTGNLVMAGVGNGIEITTDNVTIDLAGFSITGVSGNPFSAIFATSPGFGVFRKNIAITNGTVNEWDFAGIELSNASNIRISHIQAYRCGTGLYLAFNNTISQCVFENCFSSGVQAGNVTTMSDCTALFNGGGGFSVGSTSVVSRCTAENNFNTGFQVGEGSVLADCTARSNFQPKGSATGFVTGDRCVATGCVSAGNSGSGFSMVNSCLVSHCTSIGNFNSGFEAFDDFSATNCNASSNSFMGIYFNGGTVTACTADRNGFRGISTFFDRALITNSSANWNGDTGIYLDGPSSVQNCSAVNNAAYGILADVASEGTKVDGCKTTNNLIDGIQTVANCTVQNCTSTQNWINGIDVGDRCTVVNNSCIDNGTIAGGGPGAGIRCTGGGARVDNNHVSGNDTGIDASLPFRNVIIRNTAFGNSPNYNLNVANDIGPIGSAAASTSPWANISF
ncbi:MAG: right-handed parallel beta-helix repeat-containing protein [Planctomycetota bacterium]